MPDTVDGTAEVRQAGLLRSIADLGRMMFGAAACSVAVLTADEEHLVFRAASGAGAEEVVGLRVPVSKGLAGWVVSSGQPIAVDEVRRDPRFARDVAESTGFVPTSILAAPLETAGETVGVIEVLDRTSAPGRDDFALLGLLARHAILCLQGVGEPSTASTEPAGLAGLEPAERAAAGLLLREFLTYVRRPGGPAGLV